MKKVKFCGRVVNFPTDWIEVTTEMWLKIIGLDDKTDDLSLMSVITGIEKDELEKSQDDNIELVFFENMQWYVTPINLTSLDVPKSIIIDGVKIEIPKDLGYKTLGQRIYMQQTIRQNYENIDKVLPIAYGVYVMPEFTGQPFDAEKIDAFMSDVVMKRPIVEVFPIGSFFLRKSLDYLNLRMKDYLKIMTQTSRPQG